jgi:hypothetical protein
MPYCKHCNEYIQDGQATHSCPKVGLLNVSEDNSFLTSAVIGMASDSALLGGLLGGDIAGGIVGDLLDGDLFD